MNRKPCLVDKRFVSGEFTNIRLELVLELENFVDRLRKDELDALLLIDHYDLNNGRVDVGRIPVGDAQIKLVENALAEVVRCLDTIRPPHVNIRPELKLERSR